MQQTDFRKFATGHLGINGQVLDDYVSLQNQYLNPDCLELCKIHIYP